MPAENIAVSKAGLTDEQYAIVKSAEEAIAKDEMQSKLGQFTPTPSAEDAPIPLDETPKDDVDANYTYEDVKDIPDKELDFDGFMLKHPNFFKENPDYWALFLRGLGQTMVDDYGVSKSKSVASKHIATLAEVKKSSASFAKSDSHPNPIATANGDITRPPQGKRIGAANISCDESDARRIVRIGPGVNPADVTKADWEDYNIYKAQKEF